MAANKNIHGTRTTIIISAIFVSVGVGVYFLMKGANKKLQPQPATNNSTACQCMTPAPIIVGTTAGGAPPIPAAGASTTGSTTSGSWGVWCDIKLGWQSVF